MIKNAEDPSIPWGGKGAAENAFHRPTLITKSTCTTAVYFLEKETHKFCFLKVTTAEYGFLMVLHSISLLVYISI